MVTAGHYRAERAKGENITMNEGIHRHRMAAATFAGVLRRAITRQLQRHATVAVPGVAVLAIAWGLIFALTDEQRKRSPALNTALSIMAPWAWGVLMVGAGLAFLVFVRPWALALLASTIAFYTLTLTFSAMRYQTVSWTGWVWPTGNLLVLLSAGARIGVRRGGRK